MQKSLAPVVNAVFSRYFLADRNLPIVTFHVYARRNFSASKMIKGNIDPRERINILSSNCIQSSIIHTKAEIILPLLFHHHNWSCQWASRWRNYPLLQRVFNLFLNHPTYKGRDSIGRRMNGAASPVSIQCSVMSVWPKLEDEAKQS